MSYIIATVRDIKACESLHVVEFVVHGETLAMMSLALSDAIMIGTRVKLAVKPTHIAIAKNLTGELSYSNQLPCKIDAIENGSLLSAVKLGYFDVMLESIITRTSLERMQLEVGDEVIALIKASELSIYEVLDV